MIPGIDHLEDPLQVWSYSLAIASQHNFFKQMNRPFEVFNETGKYWKKLLSEKRPWIIKADEALSAFKKNLENKCVTDLERNFKGDKYKATLEVSYDSESSLFVIESLEIGINDGAVERIKKIKIGEDSIQVDSQDPELGKKTAEVKEFVSSRYDIDEDKIYVYKAQSTDN